MSHDNDPYDDPCYDCDDRRMPVAARGCEFCEYGQPSTCRCDFDKFTDDQDWSHDMYGCEGSRKKLYPQLEEHEQNIARDFDCEDMY